MNLAAQHLHVTPVIVFPVLVLMDVSIMVCALGALVKQVVKSILPAVYLGGVRREIIVEAHTVLDVG